MKITIVTPQFDRADGKIVIARPQGVEQFQALKKMSISDLKAMGCGIWEENDKCYHFLYPKEWYNDIPAGLEVVDIFNSIEKFQPGVTDDDTRFGLLSYGFLVAKDV